MGGPRRQSLVRGTRDHYLDAQLYDHEYRRRRADVRFYRAVARAFGGAVLELGAGTGRISLGLARDGHSVVAVDLNFPMLARARERVARLPRAARPRLQLVCADMQALPLCMKFKLIIAPFNALQHIYTNDALTALFVALRRRLDSRGCIVFDVLNPDLKWLVRDPNKRWARTRFKHPVTQQAVIYSTNQTYDPVSQIAWVRIYYDPPEGDPGRSRVVHLAHRQFFPQELRTLVHAAGLQVAACYGDFGGEPLSGDSESQIISCCRPDDARHVVDQLECALQPRG